MEPSHSDFRIEKTTHLLHENSSRTVAEVAGACSLSTSRLSHLFKAEVGTTVGKFRRTCRFSKAKTMLANTPEVAIKAIAYTLGYHHTSSFTRAFEHDVGATVHKLLNGAGGLDYFSRLFGTE